MIFLIGHRAAGKTSVARYLVSDFNFFHAETGEIIRSHKKSTDPNLAMPDWVSYIEANFGLRYLDEVIRRNIEFSIRETQGIGGFQELIVSGNRSLSGTEYLGQTLPEDLTGKRRLIVAIESPSTVLYERFISRNREEDERMSRVDFEETVIRKELESGLGELLERADYKIVNDTNSQEVLRTRVDELFRGELGYRKVEARI